ncbi:MAG TPA: ABC transporter [Arenimonas sp.]|nr:MAG: hypothetical protein A2X76_04325 [Xanthomonadales bacterium GWF1_69_6]HBD20865.1 ABC transporter [Arenimonas sp.]
MTRRAPRLLALAAALSLAGCSIVGPTSEVQIFAPRTAITADSAWPAVDWQLSVSTPDTHQLLDSTRIAVRPAPDRLQTYKGARWADSAPELLQTALVQAFEDSGRIAAVGRFGGTRGDFGLFTELRAFETVYSGGRPEVVVELQARLVALRGPGGVTAKRFRVVVPSEGEQIEPVVAAFGQAMTQLSQDVVGWTLVEGQRVFTAKERSAGK